MIRIFPEETETLVLPIEQPEVLQRFEAFLDKPFVLDGLTKLVQGDVSANSFLLNIRTRRHEFFMPLIYGTMEPTSKGTLVFVRYTLSPGTKALLSFWTIFLPVLAIPLYLETGNIWVFAGFIAFTVFMHVIARANFHLQQKTARRIVNQLLT